MAKASGELWSRQAQSDLDAANRMLDIGDASTYCHALAKYQQSVEKSIKSIITTLRDAGIISKEPGWSHEVEKDVSALIHLPSSPTIRDTQTRIKGLLNDFRRGEIRALCALAPKRPAPGELFRRNTEYPYQKSQDEWTIPSSTDAFTLNEVRRFEKIAHHICIESSKLITALRRAPGSS